MFFKFSNFLVSRVVVPMKFQRVFFFILIGPCGLLKLGKIFVGEWKKFITIEFYRRVIFFRVKQSNTNSEKADGIRSFPIWNRLTHVWFTRTIPAAASSAFYRSHTYAIISVNVPISEVIVLALCSFQGDSWVRWIMNKFTSGIILAMAKATQGDISPGLMVYAFWRGYELLRIFCCAELLHVYAVIKFCQLIRRRQCRVEKIRTE